MQTTSPVAGISEEGNRRPQSLLEVRGLTKHFPLTKGLILQQKIGVVRAVDGVDFSVEGGETFGLVGESGCGKTTLSRLLLLLETPTSGTMLFDGQDIAKTSRDKAETYRRSVQAVFQDPYSSLSPRMRVGDIIKEPMVVRKFLPRRQMEERVAELLEMVGLDASAARRYPHEFSGGQRQRIAIARALSLNARLVILDEPVSALDVSIRSQIMNVLRDLQRTLGLAYVFIAHDLAAVHHMSDRVGVMYFGKLVEVADSDELYLGPLHPYTQGLLAASLPADPDKQKEAVPLQGEVPSHLHTPVGCRFHSRCPSVTPICTETEPSLKYVTGTHMVACHLH